MINFLYLSVKNYWEPPPTLRPGQSFTGSFLESAIALVGSKIRKVTKNVKQIAVSVLC